MTKTACRSPTWWLRHNGGERRTIQWAAVLCQEQKWSILRGHSKKSPERRCNLSSTALSFVLISKQKNIVFYTHTCSCFSLEQQTLILILICTKLAPCLPYTKPNHIHAHGAASDNQGDKHLKEKPDKQSQGAVTFLTVRQTDAVCIQAASEGWRTRARGLIAPRYPQKNQT